MVVEQRRNVTRRKKRMKWRKEWFRTETVKEVVDRVGVAVKRGKKMIAR